MFVISKNITNEIVIKNSRFICLLYRINSVSDIKNYLALVKKDYPKATHYCYSYIIDDLKKMVDDGEPGGTAGMPILNVLDKNNLTNVLAIVVRYFGGIKLGAGSLVRAYSKSVSDCLLKVNLNELISGYQINVFIKYEEINDLDYLLAKEEILQKEFLEQIIYTVNVSKECLKTIEKKGYKYEIISDIYIEKK